jgi:iron complex outermembrane receptor protein
VRLSDEQVSWDLSANYEVNPDLNVYARAAKGFRGPTIQGRSAVFNSDFTTANSETILSWEAGFKSTLLDNTLRLNASAFTYKVKDIQLNGNDSNGNGVLFNADKAKAYGLEADAEWRPIANLTLTAGLSLLHSEIHDKRVYAQVCALNSVVVCTVKNPTIAIVGPFGTSTSPRSTASRCPTRRSTTSASRAATTCRSAPTASCSSPPTGTCRAIRTSCSTTPTSSTRRATSKAG